jgi:hypothetical protein
MSIHDPGLFRFVPLVLAVLLLSGCVQPAPDSPAPWVLAPLGEPTPASGLPVTPTPFMPGALDTEVV